MIIKVKGKKCQYEDCDKEAEVIACGSKEYPEPNVYCLIHGRLVCGESSPEYTTSCPNCNCLFGVN